MGPVERLRLAVGRAVRSRVAGEDADAHAHLIWEVDGERWHTPSDVIWHINGDAAMYSGGIRALLLQSLHPAAMAGVAGHSGYRDDPWGRLQRTADFIAMTTYGPVPSALALIERVKGVHERVRGKTDDGTPYRASDPHLLAWVHIAETESFLTSFQRFGDRRLAAGEADDYVADAAPVGELLGAEALPLTEADLRSALEAYRPELRASEAARETVRFLLKDPPIPWIARPGYWMLAAGAICTLPQWAREELRLPTSRVFDALIGVPFGRMGTAVIRWALVPESRKGRWAPADN